jgi:non-ribosomal peptide synthetase component F/acyl carrier protein
VPLDGVGAQRLADEQLATSFDLAAGPLFHCLLVKLGDTEHLLSITIHHIVSDAWSVGLFLRELSAGYRAGGDAAHADLPELPVQYRDYAVWQRDWLTGDTLEAQVGYWREQLAGAPPALALPVARRRTPAQGAYGDRVRMALDREETAAVHKLSREYGATPYMALLASLATVLGRWSGQDDLVIGAPVSTRRDAGTHHLIGCFVNTLPMRVDLTGDPAFTDVLARVRQVALDGYAHHGETPLDVLVSKLSVPRDPTRTPLFQVILNMVDSAEREWQLPGISVELVDMPALPSKFDLTLNVHEAGGCLRFELIFHGDRYDQPTMCALLDQLRALLNAAAADPTKNILEYPLADPPRAGQSPVPRPAPAPHLAVERHARQHPDRVAVVGPDGSWTYGQLHQAVARVAGTLAGTEGGVGVVKRPGAGFVAAILACGRAGVPYSIVDAGGQHPYLATVLDPDLAELATGEPAPPGEPGAYPDWAVERFDLTGDDRFAALPGTPGQLASAVASAVTAGATLAVPDEANLADPDALAKWLHGTGVTVCYLTPPLLRALASGDPVPALPALRYAFVDNAGDLLARDVDLARTLAPACRVVSVYGLTGTGEPLAAHPVPDTWSVPAAPLRVPLGTEVAAGTAVLTVAGRPAATGEVGEIHAGARRTGDLARRRPDGTLELVPGDVADPLEAVAALRDRPEVHDALVTEYLDLDGEAGTAVYVAGAGGALDAAALRQHLSGQVPEYLVPRQLVPVDRLPLTPDGEYDLAALPDPARDGAAADSYVAPRTPIERQLIEIFEELLDVDRVGVHDTFFELNGFSLLATQLASRIRETFQVELSLREVFSSPTVESLAQLIVQAQLESAGDEELRALLDEIE